MTHAQGRSRPAVLFDLDGTLVHTLPDLAGAANAFLAEHGKPALSDAQVQAMVGDGLVALAGRVMAAGGIRPKTPDAVAEKALRFRQLYEARGHAHSAAYPGVADTLQALRARGFRLAVCTNKTEAMGREILAHAGIEGAFATVGGSDSFAARKPDPAHVRGVLERLGTAPAAAVMVGDGGADVKAAKGAGVPVIAVAYGYGLQAALAAGPDTVVAAFADLLRVIDGLLAAAPGQP